MDEIKITFEDGWKVQQGEKYADNLSYDEMLGVVVSLTLPEKRPCLNWMRTKEQHKEYMNKITNNKKTV